jgi:tetratricopeptide (TPR) repeat protein
MGDISSIQQDYNESLKKYHQSIHYFELAKDTVEATYQLIYIGRVYRFQKDFKNAQLHYKKALKQTSDSLLNGLGYQEIGINYYRAKEFDSAQYHLRKSLQFPYTGTNYAIRCFNLADLFLDIKQYDSAFHYANLALNYPATFFNLRDCYRILANTEYNKGNLKEMANYISKYQDCSDSVRKVESQTKSSVLENLYQTTDKVSKTQKYILVLVGGIALIIALSVLIVTQLRKKTRSKEMQLKKTEAKLTKKELLLKESLIQKIEENKQLQAYRYKGASLREREAIDKEIYNNCLHVNDWEAFKLLMNKTFNNIITVLEKKHADINQKELIWCCLFLLEIPIPDMSLILEAQPTSLYKLKQRLAQKLKLNTTKELDQWLQKLAREN